MGLDQEVVGGTQHTSFVENFDIGARLTGEPRPAIGSFKLCRDRRFQEAGAGLSSKAVTKADK
ncbi:hypothetical protein X748_04120 [Mesorhizobium sp. LNJC386A00]|nr:hypothetical protein X748_04120 [Mesorhizobium sp. LNJC386A00]